MSLLAVTVLGHDRPGIIAEVTGVLAELGGNLEDSSMTLLRGHFAMTLVVRTDAGDAEVRDALEPRDAEVRDALEPRFRGNGLDVSVIALPDQPPPAQSGIGYVLSVHGADRAGIVSAITAVIAAHGGNVTDLTTRLAGDLYVLIAEVELPTSADVAALQGALSAAASELGVEATLREAESDLL
jgi:glycine cleavage system transcriptional repressor